MAGFHRKLLPNPKTKPDPESCTPLTPPPLPVFRQLPTPPSPPPPPPSLNHSFSPLLVIMFGGLTVSFCFVLYLTCVTSHRRSRRTNYDETRQDFVNEDLGPVIHHPIWFINTIGLDQSQIESIHMFKYNHNEKLIEGTDCSVCLSEFEDDESLRLLPKCNHAFHVPCIDTWLRCHKNCPLCRAPIVDDTSDQTEHAIAESNLIHITTSEESETPVNDSETIDDHDHVVEVENSGEIAKTYGNVDETRHHVQGEESVTMRRSFSNSQLVVMKKPSSGKKSDHKLEGSSDNRSSSFARSLRKASSFTSKYGPYNQSY